MGMFQELLTTPQGNLILGFLASSAAAAVPGLMDWFSSSTPAKEALGSTVAKFHDSLGRTPDDTRLALVDGLHRWIASDMFKKLHADLRKGSFSLSPEGLCEGFVDANPDWPFDRARTQDVLVHFHEELARGYVKAEGMFFLVRVIQSEHITTRELISAVLRELLGPDARKALSDALDKADVLPRLYNACQPVPDFVGRATLLDKLGQWYCSTDVTVATLVAWGGEGKSSIARQFYDQMPQRGLMPERVFWWGFYGQQGRYMSTEGFIDALYLYLGGAPGAAANSDAKVEALRDLIPRAGELLVVLDGLEVMQQDDEHNDALGSIPHQSLKDLLSIVVELHTRGLWLITTRLPVRDIDNWEGRGVQRQDVKGLEEADARVYFEKKGIQVQPLELESLVAKVKGHAQSLTTIAGYVNKYCSSRLECAQEFDEYVHSDKERFKDVFKLFNRYKAKMDAKELAILQFASLYQREVSLPDMQAILVSKAGGGEIGLPLAGVKRNDLIDLLIGLDEWRLIGYDRAEGMVSLHPIVRMYFEQSIISAEQKRACHEAIYRHIDTYAPKQADSIKEMAPLFDMVYHGCRAGRYDEVLYDVFWQRIQRGNDKFLIYKLGAWETAIGLVKCFFEAEDFSKDPLVTKDRDRSFLLCCAGIALQNIGRTSQAINPLKRSVDIDVKAGDNENASTGYRNLADMELSSGKVNEGLSSAREALRLARLSGHEGYVIFSTCQSAYASFLMDDVDSARAGFDEATRLAKERHPGIYGLYSLNGTQYAQFLMSQGQWEEAGRLTEENLKWAQGCPVPADISRCHCMLGLVRCHEGSYDEASKHLQEALKMGDDMKYAELQIEAHIGLARLGLATSDHPGALACLDNAGRIITRSGYVTYEPEATLIRAQVAHAAGDLSCARTLAFHAQARATEMGYLLLARLAREFLSTLP